MMEYTFATYLLFCYILGNRLFNDIKLNHKTKIKRENKYFPPILLLNEHVISQCDKKTHSHIIADGKLEKAHKYM